MSKVVLITGGSSGIGKSVGEFLHSKGFKVYGTSRNPEKFRDSIFPLLMLDVRDKKTIFATVNEIISKSGRLDVVINNAGIGITGALEEMPMEEIKNNFETNLFGPIEVMKAVLPQMRLQKSGHIINITSIAGYIGLPYRSVYSASKGALELISESVRMEVNQFGIQISNIAPGDFATPIATRRFHSPLIEGSPYYENYNKTLKNINKAVDYGDNPIKIGKKVYRIIMSKKPKIHYKAGSFLQQFAIVLKRILPDNLFEKILQKNQ